MKNWQIHSIPFLGILFFLVGWKLLYPWLGYMLDSDAVGYLTVAERVARGDYATSINSLWSPLNSWLLLVYRHEGMNFFFRAQLWNVFFGIILLIQVWLLMGYFKVKQLLRLFSQISLSLVMIYLVYYQVFADLLQCVFLLGYIMWVLFRQSKSILITTVGVGIIIGIGFYGKAYTWFFFALHFLAWQLWLFFQHQQSIKKSLYAWGIAIIVSLLVMSPWIFAIHQKFGIWTVTGLAGKLNMSWYINSGKTFNDSIHLLIPPTYTDSPSFWEDPYPSQGTLTSPFSSCTAFVHWIARCFHTSLNAIICYAELSIFALLLIGWGVFYFLFRNRKEVSFNAEQFVMLALLVLPLGYLTMHIETRYLWLTLFLLPLVFDRWLLLQNFKNKWLLSLLWVFGFLVFPLMQVEQLREKNKDLFDEAEHWNRLKFNKQGFTSSVSDEGRMWVLAYLTHSMYYTIEASSFTERQLIAEMKRYQIRWYFHEKVKCNDGLHFVGNLQWKKSFETERFIAYELIP